MEKKTNYEFSHNGQSIKVTDPRAFRQADGDLWNDQLFLKIQHTGEVTGKVMTPNPQDYAESGRYIYLRKKQTGESIRLPWSSGEESENPFSFELSQTSAEWERQWDSFHVKTKVSLPRKAALETWLLELENKGEKEEEMTVTIAIPTGILGLLSHESEVQTNPFRLFHAYFPYYVKIEDYEKLARKWNVTFACPDREPDSWTALERDFLGFGNYTAPDSLINNEPLKKAHVHYERGIIAMQFNLKLKSRSSESLGWIIGAAKSIEHANTLIESYPPADAARMAIEEQEQFFNDQKLPFQVESPDEDLDHFCNVWAPHRSIQIGKTLRFNPAPQARNAIQDSMALTWFNPEETRKNFLAIWAHQKSDGFMPHGLPMKPDADIMPITLIPHRDINAWGPLALDVYLRETNDFSILDEEIPYIDGGTDTLAAHIEKGLSWLLADRTDRGLSKIGQGDWNDPLNMVGPKGIGESIWLTEATAYACSLWADTLKAGNRNAGSWAVYAEECREAIRKHAWDGNWFIRAVSDDGILIGSSKNEEGAIYLNAQSWAMMANIPDKNQQQLMISAIEKHLMTEVGPALLAPPYTGMVKHVGKLTLKSPGTGENGSVYSHAALFYAFALYQTGESDRAWNVFRNLLTGTKENPTERSGQLPIYIPNFFRGPASQDIFGVSSHAPTTGSAAWFYMIFLEQVLGLKAKFGQLAVSPNIPKEWSELKASRRLHDKVFHFNYKRTSETTEVRIYHEGVLIQNNTINPDSFPDSAIFNIELPAIF